ncbi:MAG: hypothetical protein RLY70_1353 [Planctomycetota bacterium]|jgi:hypothetical protein
MAETTGPHRAVAGPEARERFAADLLDRLWWRYRERVGYVQVYERLIAASGGSFTNDHIALRTLASQIPFTGIATLGRIFEALGWRAAGVYQFPDKALNAQHFEHPNPAFPKIFISELQTWTLSASLRETLAKSVRTHRLPVSDETLALVAQLDLDSGVHASAGARVSEHAGGKPASSFGADANASSDAGVGANGKGIDERRRAALLDRLVREFHELPWNLPERSDVERANRESQYAAWVLLHGYNVNHFTALINSQGVPALSSIEATAAALAAAGVPMKAEIEGAPGSKLRQTATAAATVQAAVAVQGMQAEMAWSYAYFELAERGDTVDPESGERRRFEGFLGPQATQLFDMTKRS